MGCQSIGQRNIIQLGGHLFAILECLVKELQGLLACRFVGGILVHQHKCCAGDRPGLGALLVDKRDAHAGGTKPIRARCCSGKGVIVGVYKLAITILKLEVRDLVFLSVRKLDVTDGTLDAGYVCSDTLIALTAYR